MLATIQAVASQAGLAANDAPVLLALWLFPPLDGVGRARELERLCTEHLAYQWLCGGICVNYPSLTDFRNHRPAFPDPLLTDGVATLMHEGLVELQRVAQDGMKVRASTGASSFRRELREEQNPTAILRPRAKIRRRLTAGLH